MKHMEVKYIAEKKELDAAYNIRKIVFVEEQGVPEQDEFDNHDAHADHILAYCDNRPVGTGRLRLDNNIAKLERICVLTPYRNQGFGKAIVDKLEVIAKEKGISKAKLHGQTHAVHFYEKIGYKQNSDVFMEDGIPHVMMTKNI